MNLLEKFGDVVLKGTSIAFGLATTFQQQFPGVIPQNIGSEIAQIASLCAMVEVVGKAANISGADKARAIGPLVAQAILASPFMANKSIADPVKFNDACWKLGGDVADLLTSLHENGVYETPKV